MSNEEQVSVAVVGAGNMGLNHVRVFDELPGANLVKVVESDRERARKVNRKFGVTVVDSVDQLERAEAASIAVPNHMHKELSVNCLERGLDILVEKPLAEDVEHAEAIVQAAAANDRILQVGHIERFNPAVELLAELLEDQEVIALEAHRLGPFNEQLSGESVVFDLMIHDIDIVSSLVDGEVVTINAVGSETKSDELDHVFTQFEFDTDIIASFTASHVTHGKIRTLDVTTEDAFVKLDYQKQDITVHRRGTEKTTTLLDRGGYRTEAVTESPYVQRVEPLKSELKSFLQNVRDGNSPAVGGSEGARAVKLASDIVERVRKVSPRDRFPAP